MNITPTQITFQYEEKEITGIASGTWFNWEFRSQSPAVKALFPDGIMNRMVKLNGFDDPRFQLLELTIKAMDEVLVIQPATN